MLLFNPLFNHFATYTQKPVPSAAFEKQFSQFYKCLLSQGRYHCIECDFTANLRQSIAGHVRKVHAKLAEDTLADKPGWTETKQVELLLKNYYIY